jgi:hypothetical protein
MEIFSKKIFFIHFFDKNIIFKRSLVEKLHISIRDDWRKYQKVPKNKWNLFYFNILNHKQYNLFITFVILLNVRTLTSYLTSPINQFLGYLSNYSICNKYIE